MRLWLLLVKATVACQSAFSYKMQELAAADLSDA
jgi:hypothetical protein